MTTDTVAGSAVSQPEPTTVKRRFRYEATLAVVAGFAISLGFNWEMVRHPRSIVLGGIGDPLLQAWELAWDRHLFSAFGTFWTTFYGGRYTFLLVWRHLPGWDSVRTPGRLILWTTLLLALLAAGAITRLAQRRPSRPWQRRLLAFALLLPAIGALLEGVPNQLYGVVPSVPPNLRALFDQSHQPTLILPETSMSDYLYTIWSTDGFPVIANGHTGNFPPQFQDIMASTVDFPNQRSVGVLEQYDIHRVVVLKDAASGTPYAAVVNRPLTGLPVTKTETGDLVVFTVH